MSYLEEQIAEKQTKKEEKEEKGRTQMAVTYKKLWHILLDRDMKKKDLQETAELTKYTMRKLGNDEAVTTDTLAKICRALNCTVDDIMEVLPEDK